MFWRLRTVRQSLAKQAPRLVRALWWARLAQFKNKHTARQVHRRPSRSRRQWRRWRRIASARRLTLAALGHPSRRGTCGTRRGRHGG